LEGDAQHLSVELQIVHDQDFQGLRPLSPWLP
jgi:hypothetical protein